MNKRKPAPRDTGFTDILTVGSVHRKKNLYSLGGSWYRWTYTRPSLGICSTSSERKRPYATTTPRMNAGRTQTAIGGFYRRLAVRAGKGKAIVATAAKLARITYTMIRKQTEYSDVGLDIYEKRYRHRVIRNLQRRAKELGLMIVEPEENQALTGAVT